MNFLAHCFLAQPTPFSLYGNLLGDFVAGADLTQQPPEVLAGLENHKLVDKFTDAHSVLPILKQLMSKDRRRFTGIISDVVFDHFLIKHWEQFSDKNLRVFVDDVYENLLQVMPLMHDRMLGSMQFMMKDDGLLVNQSLEGVGTTLDRLSHRIRFENKLFGAVDEVERYYIDFEKAFLWLFPELIAIVEERAIEI
ncbi:MAG: ACP phosphodiesterase [Arenicella sp.]